MRRSPALPRRALNGRLRVSERRMRRGERSSRQSRTTLDNRRRRGEDRRRTATARSLVEPLMILSGRLILWTVAVALGGVLAFVAFAPAFQGSNCGGNSAAMHVCAQFAAMLHAVSIATDSPASPDDLLAQWGPRDVRGWTRTSWLDAEFMVADPARPVDPAVRSVVIVCSESYGNVPRPSPLNLYRKNSAHAVGYSDGTVDLISPREYEALDLEQFVAVTDWLPDISTEDR